MSDLKSLAKEHEELRSKLKLEQDLKNNMFCPSWEKDCQFLVEEIPEAKKAYESGNTFLSSRFNMSFK
jgi:hypothetical protein